MKILAIGQVESDHYLDEIAKQTLVPHDIKFLKDLSPAKGIDNRRKRIAENHKLLKEYIENTECDLIWQIEGDSILEEDTLEKLLTAYNNLANPDFGYISGIQVGRHGLYSLGAWVNIKDESFESLDYRLKGIQEVEAAGFYCLLMEKNKWLEGHCSWNGERYGPDVVWSRSLRYNKYVSMDIPIGHRVKGGVIWPSHISTCNVKFTFENNQWDFKTYE